MPERSQKRSSKDSKMLPGVESGKGNAHGNRDKLAHDLAREKQLERECSEKLNKGKK
jgi:hypothetical protein